VRLFFEALRKSAGPLQCLLVIVNPEEQQEAVPRRAVVGPHQRRMVLDAPLMNAEQDSSIRIEELPKVGMTRRPRRLAEQRLVPLEAPRHIAHADDRPRAFHGRPPNDPTSLREPRILPVIWRERRACIVRI
jgi:hypothetical protein